MNDLLRDHVTSAAFVLSLGKTHVAELVRLDLELAAEVHIDYRSLRTAVGPPRSSPWRMDVGARHGLTARGLIVHVWPQNEHKYMKRAADGTGRMVRDMDKPARPGEMWNITRAGRLVIELLREAGIYQEYAGPLLPLVEATKTQRKARAS